MNGKKGCTMSDTMTMLDAEKRRRYETIDGVPVLMAPSASVAHNTVGTNLVRILGNYLHGKRCRLFMDGVDVHFDEKNTLVPDLTIVCDRNKIKANGIHGTPDLVVEVLSPSTAKRDRMQKKAIYERFGVKEYWLINPVEKSIEVYLLRDGKLDLDNVYAVYEEWQWKQLTEEERAAAQLSVKVSLYDDLTIDIRDIFDEV